MWRLTRPFPRALRRAQIHAAFLANQAWSQRAEALLIAGDSEGTALAQDRARDAADEHQLLTRAPRPVRFQQLPLF